MANYRHVYLEVGFTYILQMPYGIRVVVYTLYKTCICVYHTVYIFQRSSGTQNCDIYINIHVIHIPNGVTLLGVRNSVISFVSRAVPDFHRVPPQSDISKNEFTTWRFYGKRKNRPGIRRMTIKFFTGFSEYSADIVAKNAAGLWNSRTSTVKDGFSCRQRNSCAQNDSTKMGLCNKNNSQTISPFFYSIIPDQVAAKMAAEGSRYGRYDQRPPPAGSSAANSSDSEQETAASSSTNKVMVAMTPKRNKRKNFKPRCSNVATAAEVAAVEAVAEYSNNNNSLKNVRRRKTMSTRKLVVDSR